MRRTVIFVTLISLLIVVAGVSAAQDVILAPSPPETTAPEPTAPEPTTRETFPDEQEGIGTERPNNDGEYDGGGRGENGPSKPEGEGRESGEESGKGGPGGSGSEDEEHEGSGGEKVAVCHKGKTLSVGAPAEPAHLGHGDSTGPC